jgi:tetratricopeptide (TPR) repeat protein
MADALRHGGEDVHFLVMEYVEGQTLRELLDELDRVPEELCRHIGREVAKGLAAIHAAGVIHRDLKPENVLITADHHTVKVMDLGVARLAEETLRLSQSGAFVGSVEYAAPEQFGAKEVGAAADLHALGLVLYELATAQHPFRADDFRAVMRRVLDEKPRRPAEINPQLSPFFEELVLQLLEKDPAKRITSAADLAQILDEGEKSLWWREKAKAIRTTTKRPLRRVCIPRETALYGRDAELARLRTLYDKAKSGEGQVLLVEGEAGIGKSRLLDEFVGLLQREGEDLNFLWGSYPPGGAATASGAFSTAYREHFGGEALEQTLPAYLVETPILVPAFAALLRGETTPTGAEPLTKDSLQTVFVHATRALARERTTIVLIEDLHFSPEDGRALFASLALATPGHRILLVGTTRPGIDEKWFAGIQRVGAERLPLARLGPKDLARLLTDAFHSARLAEELAGKIGIKSDGNPYFAFEIIRGLREGQFIARKDDGTWVTTRVIGDLQIPSSVLDLVNARVADLDDDERNLLDVASCCGFEFDPVLVARAAGLAPVPAMQRLARVEKRHRLVRSSARRFLFDHHQVQEALYGAIPEPLREAYHAAIAHAIESCSGVASKDAKDLDGALCVDLAEHFLKGGQGARALRYLDAALSHLERGYLNDHAVRLAEHALSVPGLLTGPDRAKMLLCLCGADSPLDRLGRRSRQAEAALEASRLAADSGDLDLRGRAMMSLGSLFWRTGRTAEAETAYREALAIVCAQGGRRGEGALSGLGLVLSSQGRLAEAKEYLERSLAICREISDREGEAAARVNLGIVYQCQGRLADAKEQHEQSLAICREMGHLQGEARATGNLGIVYQSQGRIDEALKFKQRYLALSREIGYREGEARSTGNLGNALHFQGRLAEAKEYQERSLALSREIAHQELEAFAQHNLGNVLREMGDTAGSEEQYLSCLAVSEESGIRELAAATHLALGSLRASLAGEGSAESSLTAARDLAKTVGAPGVETLARCELSLPPWGDPADALSAFTEHEERLSVDERLEARHLLWRATGDRTHLVAAKRLLDESVANVDAETRASMLANLRVNREIVAACKEQGL